MKRQKKVILLCTVALLLAAAWTWRYITLNQYFQSLSKRQIAEYALGETVEFGTDFIEDGISAEGCTIQVEHFEIADYESYLKKIGYIDDNVGRRPEKLALVTIVLTCGEKPADIFLPEFCIHGIDTIATVDDSLISPVNGFPEYMNAVYLEPGRSYRLTLPYPLHSYLFGSDTWKNMDKYTFWFRATSYLTEKDIRLN